MTVCSGIVKGASFSCSNPLKSSVSETLLLGNLDDIQQVIYDPAKPDDFVIQEIIMKAGTSLFKIVGARSSNIPDVSQIIDEFSVQFQHQVAFSYFEVSSSDKTNIQGMAARKTFAIYENPNDTSLGDSIIEALGINSGLETTVITRAPATKDGSYKITLTTPAAAGETRLPNSVFDPTGLQATKDMLAAITSGDNLVLLTATVETGSPNDIILTFDKTITNFGTISVGGTANSIVSATIAGPVVTVVVGTPYAAAEPITITGSFDAADGRLQLSGETVINNVA